MPVLTPRNVFAPGREPPKLEVIQLFEQFFGSSSAPAVVRQTAAALQLVTPEEETYGGLVLNDPDPAENGYWYRSGGVWVWGRGFPDTFARVVLSGSGAAQTGLVSVGVNPADIEVFFAVVATPNTGALTLSISGETPRPVLNLAGNPVSAGEWTGVVMFFLNDDGEYQLLIDAGAAASAAQSATDAADERGYAEEWAQSEDPISVEAGGDGVTDRSSKWHADRAEQIISDLVGLDEAVDEAEASADRAQTYAAMLSVDRIKFNTVSAMIDDTAMGYSGSGDTFEVDEGDIIEAQGFRYEVAASDVSDEHVETAGGVKLYSLSDNVISFGAIGDGSTVDTSAIQAALNTGRSLFIPQGQFIIDQSLTMDNPGQSLVGFGTPYFGAVSEIKLVSGTPQPVFITDGEGFTFRNLKITGQSTAVGSIGIQVGPTSGHADRDVYITNCFINTTQDCVYSYGRGVYVEDSRLVATGNCLNLNWPDPFTQTGGVDDTEETGFRAIYLRNCRLQAIAGRIVRNVGANAANLNGLTLVGNYVDGRNGVIYGSVRNGNVSANTFVNSNSIMFLLDDVDGLTISANTFSGMHDSTGNVTTRHTADIENIVYLNSGFAAKGITFSGNTVDNLYKDGFFLNGTWSDINISGNTFLDALRGNNDTALSPTQYGIVRTNTAGSGLVFANNVCEVGDYSRNAYLVNSGGSIVGNWVVQGNVFNLNYIDETNLALGTFTPLLAMSGTGFSSVTYATTNDGIYHRIGKMVFVQFSMRTEAITLGGASGNVQIDLNDLPYTCIANNAGKSGASAPITIGSSLNWTNGPIAGQIRPGEKKIDLFKRSSTTSNIANLTTGDLALGASSNILQVSLMFMAR